MAWVGLGASGISDMGLMHHLHGLSIQQKPMGAGCSENIMFMCMNTQEHHVPTTPMGVPTWEHDVSPKKCDINIGGREEKGT